MAAVARGEHAVDDESVVAVGMTISSRDNSRGDLHAAWRLTCSHGLTRPALPMATTQPYVSVAGIAITIGSATPA